MFDLDQFVADCRVALAPDKSEFTPDARIILVFCVRAKPVLVSNPDPNSPLTMAVATLTIDGLHLGKLSF
jgi:hypothetical protein